MAKGNGNTPPHLKERVSFSKFYDFGFLYKGKLNGKSEPLEVYVGGRESLLEGVELTSNMTIEELFALLPGKIQVNGKEVFNNQSIDSGP